MFLDFCWEANGRNESKFECTKTKPLQFSYFAKKKNESRKKSLSKDEE